MSVARGQVESAYLHWAKLSSAAPVNLATSAVAPFPLAELPLSIEDVLGHAPGAYGYPPLQERLARYTGVDADCIVAAPGASMANYLAMAATLEPGDGVLLERPTYEPMLAAARFLGAEVRRFERRREDGFRVNPEEVERALTPGTRLIVLANLHNPTSALAREDDLRAIGAIAAKGGARVLVDEVYLEGLYGRRPRPAFRLGPQFVVTSSLTKAFGLADLRCGWVVAEPSLAQRIWRVRDLHDVNSAHAAERIAVVALDHIERLAARAERLLAVNRPLAERFLDAHPHLAHWRPECGNTIALRAPVANPERSGREGAPGGAADDFCQFVRERYETAVVPGRFFEMPDCFRLGIGGETAELREGLSRLAAAVEEFSRG